MASFRRLLTAVSASVLIAFTTGCPMAAPTTIKGEAAGKAASVALSTASQVENKTLVAAPGAAAVAEPVKPSGPAVKDGEQVPPFQFAVDFGEGTGDRQVQVEPKDIAGRTFVTLINAKTGTAIGGNVSDSQGRFSLSFAGGWSPQLNELYILEAAKGLGPATANPAGTPDPNGNYFNFNKPGYAMVRVRTLMKFDGQWTSLSKGGITINRGTTALAAIYGLRLGSAKELNSGTGVLMESVEVKQPADSCTGATDKYVGGTNGKDPNLMTCGDSTPVFSNVWKIVNEQLLNNQDSIGGVGMDLANLDRFFPIITPPAVTSISGTTGPVGTTFTLNGGPFRQGQTQGYLNGLPLTTTWVNQGQIQVTLSNGCAQTSCNAQQTGLVPSSGPLAIGVSGALNLTVYNITVQARYSSWTASEGPAGTTFQLNGDGFDPGQTTVFFVGAGGSPNVDARAKIAKTGDTILVTVPRSACTGAMVISGPSGNLTTSTFTVLPVVEAVSTSQGRPGDNLTLTGSGFGPSPGLVEFGCSGCNGNINSWSINSISVGVPGSATSGLVRVQTNGGSGSRWSPSGPSFKVQFTISSWSWSSSWSPTTLTLDGAGFGSDPRGDANRRNTDKLVGTSRGAKIRVKSWTGTRIVAAAYCMPGERCDYQLFTAGGPAGGVNPIAQRDFYWNGALSRRVVSGWGPANGEYILFHHERNDRWWRTRVNGSGNSLENIRARQMPGNGCRITNMVLDSWDNLYMTDHCGRVRKWVFDDNMDNPYLEWERGGFPALQRIAINSSNNVYIKQHGCKSCRRWARNYYLDTKTRDFWDIGVTNGRATSGGGTLVSSDDNYYVFNARQGRCQRIQRYFMGADNPGGSERMNMGRNWEVYCHCGGPARNPHRIPSGLAEDTSGRKWFLHVWGGMSRSNSGWGMDARWSGYRCSWHATIGTDLQGNVYAGNMGCHGGAGVIIYNGGPSTWLNNNNGWDVRF